MKIVRLSIAVAMTALSSQVFAADTLADAFKNGSLSGEIKAFYFNKDNGTDREDIVATGLMLKYLTDEYMGFKAGATFQSSSTPFIDDGGKTMFRNDMWAQGAQLSEAYLAYTFDKTTLKYGRMFMSTPLVASSGSRLIRESFEGAHITNTNLPNTVLGAVYVDKFQARTDRDGDVGKFKNYNDGTYSLYAINKSIPNLTLIGAWAHIDEQTAQSDLNIYYAEAIYANKLNQLGYTLAGQYWANKYTSG
ncbi:MAG: outer membrane porin, OprD family, partial [Campylobacterales bacterium]|nr:outer membrane porin, OprD family [Campylobacterales bacterium]